MHQREGSRHDIGTGTLLEGSRPINGAGTQLERSRPIDGTGTLLAKQQRHHSALLARQCRRPEGATANSLR